MALPPTPMAEARPRKHRRWLLLLLVPAVIVCAPFLFIAAKMGTELQSALTGPVNVWNQTYDMPTEADLAGFYQLSPESLAKLRSLGVFVSDDSGFRLNSNHTAEVIDMPAFDGIGSPQDCHYNGKGVWSVSAGSGGKQLTINLATVVASRSSDLRSCAPDFCCELEALGHSPPYHFWDYIGDPDEDEGLDYQRRP